MLYKTLEALTRRPLFRRERPPERARDVVVWWESRRIPFNLIVGAAGIASALVMLLMGLVTENVVVGAIDAQGSPIFAIVAVIFYGIAANICFTGGWILELLSRRLWGTRAEAFGEIAFTWRWPMMHARVAKRHLQLFGDCRVLGRDRR